MPAPRSRWFLLALAALILIRFVFISHDDIRAFPYDGAAYVGQAAGWYWGNDYNSWTYSRQPGYPLFLALGCVLGIPARLMIEGVWVLAIIVLARVMRAAGVRGGGVLLLAALLLFHPFPTELFCIILSDNLYAVSLLVMLTALACAITRRNRASVLRWGLLAGLSGAIAAITRQETVLIYILIGLAGAIVLKTWALGSLPRRLALRRLLLGCALPLVITLGAEHAVRAANLIGIGAYVTYDWSLPGFKELYRTMLSIPPGDPRVRVPIPRDVRERAAAPSPTYAKMLDVMENHPRCAAFRKDGELTTGTPGEPGSYNLWLLRAAAWELHDDSFASARETDLFYRGVARELRAAQDRGELPRRWVPLSFIPPDWGQLAAAMPGSLAACWSNMTRIGFERTEPYPVSEIDRRRFDAIALRRIALQHEPATGVLWHTPRMVARVDSAKRAIAAALPALTVAALILAALGAAAGQALRRSRSLPPIWYSLSAMLWGAFLLRLALVAILDATGVLATNRYMFPNAVILVPMAVLGLRAVIVWGFHARTSRAAA